MIEIYKKANQLTPRKKQFSMPLSLEIITDCGEYGITNWDKLHIVDFLSIIYGVRIRRAENYLEQQRQAKMQQRGIQSITKASTEDFDNL